MDTIHSVAQLEYKLVLYKEGIISDTEFRQYCSMVGVPMPATPYQPPSEKTRLKHEAKRLRREMAKIKKLRDQRGKVADLRRQLDDLICTHVRRNNP